MAEKASTAAESVEAIHSAVAMPVDEILNDAVNVMERYIGLEPEVVERLQRILRNARDIKQVIQKVGQKMAPAQAHPQTVQAVKSGRSCVIAGCWWWMPTGTSAARAHALLERYGCVVETAPDGGEAIFMVRNLLRDGGYDAIIADIRLPDMTGYEFIVKLQEADGTRAADPHDRLRLRSGAFDREGPAGGCAGGALQAVPPGPALAERGSGYFRRAFGRPADVKGTGSFFGPCGFLARLR